MKYIYLILLSINLFSINLSAISPIEIEKYKKLIEKNSKSIKVNNVKEPLKIENNISKSDFQNIEIIESEIIDSSSTIFDYKEKVKKNKTFTSITTKELPRFSQIFFNNKNTRNPILLPDIDSYKIKPGDAITIYLHGQTNTSYDVNVNGNGNLYIGEMGNIKVVGLSLKEMKSIIINKMKNAYPNTEIIINMQNYSAISITLSGYVNNPGIYNLSSYSSIKDLIITAKGINSNASVRNIKIRRGNKTIYYDFYKTLLQGEKNDVFLQSGDIVYVPKAKKLITIQNGFSKNAIFELKNENNYKSVLNLAGGLKTTYSRSSIKLIRFQNNKNSIVKTLSLSKLKNLRPKNGDIIEAFKIHENSSKKIFLYGNIINPGEKELPKNLSLKTLLEKEISFYGKQSFFLKNTKFDTATIKRDVDGKESIIFFNINKILNEDEKIQLRRLDEINIFSQDDIKEKAYIYISGKVINKDKKVQFFNGLRIKDLFNITKFKKSITTDKDGKKRKILLNVDRENILVKRRTREGNKEYLLNLYKTPNFLLKAFDEVQFFDYYDNHTKVSAFIYGEIFRSGEYIISKNESLNEMIAKAGGLTKKAYMDNIEIVRYYIENNERKKRVVNISLNDETRITIKEDDEIYIRTIPNYSQKKYITISGQVKFAGRYAIEDGEKLADVLRRAGGFTKNSFLEGSVFKRDSIQKLQEQALAKSLQSLQQKAAYIALSANSAGERSDNKERIFTMVNSLVEEAKKTKPVGRLSIDLNKNLTEFAQSNYNIVLEDGDTLYVPIKNDTITIVGEVLNPSSFVYNEQYSLMDYINKAGGLQDEANEDSIFIIGANGESRKYANGFFTKPTKVRRGSIIIVPKYIQTSSGINILKDIADITYKLAITAASLKTIGGI